MQILNPDEQQRLQSELSNGESLVWTGKPNPNIIFHPSDWYMIPFSLLWGGFAIFWEGGVTGFFGFTKGDHVPSFMVLWGIPFVLIGQYFIWGRFFYAAWKKKRILYAITNRRVLVLSLPPQAKIISSFIESISAIDRDIHANGSGTLKFGQIVNQWGRGGNFNSMDGLYLNAGVPVFVDIDDAANVYGIVADHRTHAARS